MPVRILGLGTSLPPHVMSQADALAMSHEIICDTDRQARLAKALFRKSGVQTRRTVVPHQTAYQYFPPLDEETDPVTAGTQSGPTVTAIDVQQRKGPTTQERMEMFSTFASPLAVASSNIAMQDAAIGAADITHLVSVSCTGFDAPGVDIDLIQQLDLPPTTQRLNIGYMGCHGAINGIRAAKAIAAEDSSARVLLCAVELCSLHYRFTWDDEGIIGNALFADGSAALIIGADETMENQKSPWQIVASGSCVIPQSRDVMSWRVGDHGFEMRLTGLVGDKIEQHLRPWLHDWLASHGRSLDSIQQWVVHPGGPKILSAVEASLGLSETETARSREVLAEFGNMSSPTVLFILDRTPDDMSGDCLLLGFGPGLVAEATLLHRDAN